MVNQDYTSYKHWDGYPEVIVRTDLKGKHRDHCLCFSCKLFTPEQRETNCPIANRVYATCVDEGISTPVWECPKFTLVVNPSD